MGAPEGLNALDPGIRMLGRELAGTAPAELLLVHCGDLPGLPSPATRLILDVREHTGSPHDCVPATLGGDALGDRRFAVAACWPRAHLGIDFSMYCLAYAATHLREGGRLLCAARKQKGGKRLGGLMERLLGNCEVLERDRGYHLYAATRGPTLDDALARELLERRYVIEDPRLDPLTLETRPGVFSRKRLDPGTAELIDYVAELELAPRRVIDLCCGVGPLAIWAARRFESASVLAVDSSYPAIELLVHNARRLDVGQRIQTFVSDGLEGLDAEVSAPWQASTDVVLINPPTHADPNDLGRLLGAIAGFLAPTGRAFAVVNRAGRSVEAFEAAGLETAVTRRGAYWIVEARPGSTQ